MRWQDFALGVALVACGGAASAHGADDAMHDPTVVQALKLLELPRAEWPEVRFGAPEGYVDREKSLELFAAFRVRRGRELDPVIYLNPRHFIFTEARAGGTDVYPLFRLASVIWHELQHGRAIDTEAAALAEQAAFLRRALVRIPSQRRGKAMAYIQALEAKATIARQSDTSARYPAVPQ